ncbi:MAG: sensor histidine kinase N-terminal domain-containing protein [Burkholderiales bacterium]|nr:sensor histidine kinase N-terminal domain-containing protein [Burkholderiales bacterium]
MDAVPGREQRSLFGEILDWMLAPLLLLWPMSLGLTWMVAQGIANRPYDRELANEVRALAQQAAVHAAAPGLAPARRRAEIEQLAALLTRQDDEDLNWYQVLGTRGELLAGAAALRLPADDAATAPGVQLRDDVIDHEPVRVASLWLPETAAPSASASAGAAAPSRALVQVAETLGKRSRLATEIIKGLILPQFAILPLAVLLVWFALARGIRPLAELQQRIRRRESTDLSAIAEGDVPEEVAPLVRAINDLLRRLDQGTAAQRHFLADAAHQLKTPLAGLRMQAELAARAIDGGRSDPAAVRHSLHQIAHSTQRASHMVNQLLSMARAEDAGQALRHQTVDLAAITRDVVRDFVPRALARRIDLGYDGPDPSPATQLQAEPVLLGELVRNLIDNALQYTPAGGTVTARVRAGADGGGGALLQVEDSGPGIPVAEREAVFRPFYRLPDTAVEGSGLGLAIVREVAERHGATLSLEDARPAGTQAPAGARFSVRFAPAAAADLTTA